MYFKVSCFSLIVQALFLYQDLCPGTFSKNQYVSFLDYCPPSLMLKPMVVQRRLKGLKWCKSIENWSIVKKIAEKNVFEIFGSVFSHHRPYLYPLYLVSSSHLCLCAHHWYCLHLGSYSYHMPCSNDGLHTNHGS